VGQFYESVNTGDVVQTRVQPEIQHSMTTGGVRAGEAIQPDVQEHAVSRHPTAWETVA